MCKKLNKSKNIGISLLTLRQVSFGLADQHLHGENFDDSLAEVEQSSQKVTTIAYPDDINHLAAFGHLLGGYDAAYYGYIWAEIIGDDLFNFAHICSDNDSPVSICFDILVKHSTFHTQCSII